ncbi:Hypothetical predicted protein [Mytilus galloprovincialis]|uniref:Uncharacterized protein n=1 Tax=Mytilus galloprovincialis TaxID=29158 RepID=A0A8B6FGC8_MYTGA|nr:Hypothetical predicted protein [Mytilus galloprovincialis]
MRKSIDDLLTNVEQNLLDDLECKHSELNSEIVNLVQQMEQQASKINQMQSEYTKLTQYPTDLQMYFGMKEIEKATSQAAKYIDDLERDDHFYEKNIQVRILVQIDLNFNQFNKINYTVAVALGAANRTTLVDVEKNELIQEIQISHYSTGVASDGKVLVTSCADKSTNVNLNEMSHTILNGLKASHISLFQGHIYGTIWQESKVSCYKSTGELLWTFKHDDIEIPRGIS